MLPYLNLNWYFSAQKTKSNSKIVFFFTKVARIYKNQSGSVYKDTKSKCINPFSHLHNFHRGHYTGIIRMTTDIMETARNFSLASELMFNLYWDLHERHSSKRPSALVPAITRHTCNNGGNVFTDG